MKWKLMLRKEAVAVTTASRPSLVRVAYSQPKEEDEDGEEENS